MDLNELKKEVLTMAEKSKELKDERANLKSEICKIARKNAEEIVIPYIKEMKNFMEKIKNMADGTPAYSDKKFYLPISSAGYELRIRSSSYGVDVFFTCTGDCPWNKLINYGGDWASLCNGDRLFHFSDWLLTEEKAQEFVEKIQEKYVDILEAWADCLEASNKSLAETVKRLSDMLKTSSTVEKHDDGTVEIHLGGRTYIGTVIEA